MTLVACWIVFPALLAALSLGWGLIVERLGGRRLPPELLIPTGFAAVVGTALFATLHPSTARLALPGVLAGGVVGLAAFAPRKVPRLDPWAACAALGVFGAFGAPVVLSGEATFTGYVKLDDTATFLALADRALEYGRSLEGLVPSSYEATLAVNLPFYPLGSLLPLGMGSAVVGQDPAWLFQPYLAFLAALLALSLYRLAGLALPSRPARAVAAVIASQAALLYGYTLWGGIKEIAAAATVALVAALSSEAFTRHRPARALAPLGVAGAALVGVLSIGAVVWLVPVVAVVAWWIVRRRSSLQPLLLVVGGAMLLVPSLLVARLMLGPGVLGSIRDGDELGNLVSALSPLQVFGIWPAGDFRFEPESSGPTYALIGLLFLAALGGVSAAAARRAWELPLYLASTVGAALLYGVLASPWIEAKAYAIASPALVLAALVGGFTLARTRRVEGLVMVGLVALGVAWSNALAFGDVTLAPRDQLAELEAIGKRFEGQGPALMTEYQPYGVRHFLRGLDAEGASELRRRLIPLRTGQPLGKAQFADLSAFRPDAVHVYRTLVLRRTPVGTRPPPAYRLVWQQRFYEVWQRPDAVPISSQAARACAPAIPLAEGTFTVPATGAYEVWVAGSVRGSLTVSVDGRQLGRVRHHLNHAGHYLPLGTVELSAGLHQLEARYRVTAFRPGEAGDPWRHGPFLLTPAARCT